MIASAYNLLLAVGMDVKVVEVILQTGMTQNTIHCRRAQHSISGDAHYLETATTIQNYITPFLPRHY